MRVLAHVHLYPPIHNAGAEWMLHTFLRDLVRRGHEARVVIHGPDSYEFEGVEIQNKPGDAYPWADVVVTHLDRSRMAALMARRSGKPCVHIVHNHEQLKYHRITDREARLVVFNSEWVRRASRWRGPSVVIHPPVIPEDYRVPLIGRNGAITLLNLTNRKGGPIFFELARRFPQRRFLAVRGSYGVQVTPSDCPNVTYHENTPDIRSIYAQTRLLLMPSAYESWGRVAVEAAVSGIPTVAAAAPGLVESLAWAGLFCPLDDIEPWVQAIELLDESEFYREQSDRALARARELDPKPDLDRFEAELLGVIA